MAQYINYYDVDLWKPVTPQPLRQMVGEGDVRGMRVGAVVTYNGQNVSLGGSCVGKVIRADGATVTLTGTINGNIAYVVLDQQCCAIEGPIQVAVCWVSGSDVTTLVVAYGEVANTQTGNTIQPSTPIPDLTQLLAQISAMQTATAAANAAANNALGNFAPAFAEATANAVGTFVTYSDGKMYYLPSGHTANATWANTSHVQVTAGGEIAKAVANFAPAFSETTAYSVGQFVTYNDRFYRFTSAHSAGAWNSSQVILVTTVGELAMVLANFAGAFSTATSYTAGQYVTYNRQFFRFTTNHSAGAWNSAHTTLITVGSEIAHVLSNLAPDYAEASAYTPGSFVLHPDGYVYILPEGHAANVAWADTTKTAVTLGRELARIQTNFAGAFSESTAYTTGQYVTHNDQFFRFTTNHAAGAWNAAHCTLVTVGSEVHRVLTNFAPAFSEATNYSIGDYVSYNDRFYRFTSNHSAGAWNISHVIAVTVSGEMAKIQANFAGAFDATAAYSAGQYVVYNNQFFRFVTDHAAGAWNSAHCILVTVGSEMTNVLRNFAPVYNEAAVYAAGSYVLYSDGDVYFLPEGHAANTAWYNTTKSAVSVASEIPKAIQNFAGAFSEDASYTAGQYVTHNNQLFRFVTSYSGAWNPAKTTRVTVGSEIHRVLTNFAPAFSDSTAYAIGQYVSYNDRFYRFTSAHAAGAWDSSQVIAVTVAGEIPKILSNTANEFSDATAYDKGDYVTRNNQLFRFVANHSAGAWNSSQATVTTVGDELVSLKNTINSLIDRISALES